MEPRKQIHQVLQAIERYKELRVIFTGSNADAGGSIINSEIKFGTSPIIDYLIFLKIYLVTM